MRVKRAMLISFALLKDLKTLLGTTSLSTHIGGESGCKKARISPR